MNQIDINSEEYPYLLKHIKDPPRILYFKGDWDQNIFENTLGAVGSRRMTRYGEVVTDKLIGEIAASGITVVSGFMYGIDVQAHEKTLESGGRTIAVMPCGIDRIHPEYQVDLHKKIRQNRGLIVSEYPGDSPPALWTYPRRNRIIVGLSQRLLVIEAGLRSGALITANIAKKYNKKIFAVPGPLTSSVSLGTSKLIKEGASIVTSSKDILFEYGIRTSGGEKGENLFLNLNKTQKKIVDLLSFESMDIDEIIRASKKTISEISSELTVLCLKKILTFNDGRYYIVQKG